MHVTGHIPRVETVPAGPLVTDVTSNDTLTPRAATLALAALAIAALGAALGVVNYRAFDLDRFFVPKELALHAGALVMVLVLLVRSGNIG